MTVYKDVTVVLVRVTDPHKGAITRNHAVVEERGTAAKDGIAAAVNAAVLPIAAAVGLERIAVADDVNILKVVAFTIDE
jgi:hypothetical protein